MARPIAGKAAKNQQLVVRLEAELRARVEALRASLSKRAGGVDLTAASVVRTIIERGCDAMERELKK